MKAEVRGLRKNHLPHQATPRVAIVHYWLVNMRGGEKVVELLCDIFPKADIFTLVHDPSSVSEKINNHNIKTSFIQRLPFGVRQYQQYLPLHPYAVEQFDLTSYDLVISSESGIAKGVILPPETCHICYCHSPMRYIWNMYHQYREGLNPWEKVIWAVVSNFLRQWDYVNSQRVDYFIANSKNVQRRIKRYYGRKSEVIYPPVEFSRFKVSEAKDYYLSVGHLTPYKKADLAVRAFNRSNKKLLIVGDGPQRKELEKLAGPSISFLGNQTDDALNEYYATCKGLIFPGEEDFGITPLEAMASGKPVIAYGKGGALETVIDGKTGILFHDQNEYALNHAVEKAEDICWDIDLIREQAKQFDKAITEKKLQNLIMQKYEEFQRSIGPEIARSTALDH